MAAGYYMFTNKSVHVSVHLCTHTQAFLDELPISAEQMRVGGVVFATRAKQLNRGNLSGKILNAKAMFKNLPHHSVGADTRLEHESPSRDSLQPGQRRAPRICVISMTVCTAGSESILICDISRRY